MALNELGRIGQRRYSGVFFEEFLPELRGARGAEVYTEMADNDSTVGAILFAIENLMRNCTFSIEPGGKSQKDKEAAEFIEGCMNDMSTTWTDTLSEILSFIPYGWSYHEIVYKRRMGKKPGENSSKYDDGLIGWKKLPIRSQETLKEWKYKEHTDELIGMEQWTVTDMDVNEVTIPIEKAMHFFTKSRKQNPEGRSVLRTAYRDWYFKKRIQEIEGIGIERDLAGYPLLEAPEGYEELWNPEEPDMLAYLANAQNIVSNIRRDRSEGLVVPPGWKLSLLSTGSRRQFDTNVIIERYDKKIATSVLTDFVLLGHESVGSFALADNKTKMFSLAVGTYLDIVCEAFNNQAIPRLIDLNGDHFKGITDYPYMKHGDIEDANLEKIGAFIQQMVGCGALTPDDDLEEYLREIANLPESKVSIPYEERKGEGQENQNQDQQTNPDGTPKAQPSQESRIEQAKEKQKEKDPDDKQEEKEAEEAKKSLGRGEPMPTFMEILQKKETKETNMTKAKSFGDIIEKFNPYHDSKGRFTSGGGGAVASFSANPDTKAGANAIARETARHEASDRAAISAGIQKVRDSVGTEAKPLKRESVNIDKIMKEGGCDRATAEKAAAEAKAIYDRVSKAEPQITADIVGAVSANSGTMYGLDFRMKQETSLGRKIASDAKVEFDGDLKAAAADVKDAVRYTAVFETSNFTQGYQNVKASLEAKGYTENRCKNYFADYAEGTSVQKAVQCVYTDKNGNRLELQFHTFESQGAKEVNHPLYEQSRAASTSKGERKTLNNRMTNISSNVPDPEGVMNIKRHK